MYLKFFGLSKEPFHITPDPEFLYLSPSHKQALGSIIYGINQRKGFIAIVGEVGVGKTTILRAYLEKARPQKGKTIYIFHSNVSFPLLLKTILQGLGLTPVSEIPSEMLKQLHEALIEEYRSGGTVVLLIDEAQNMPIRTLENLRMLSNLESSTDKLIQVVLIGQPELEDRLNRHELRQLRQRIAIWAKIEPLTKQESRAYIDFRIAQVTEEEVKIFTKGAVKLLVNVAGGIPRRLNVLCDNALVTGFGYQTNPVSSKIVREIIFDIDGWASQSFWRSLPWGALASLFLVGLALVVSLNQWDSWRGNHSGSPAIAKVTTPFLKEGETREARRPSMMKKEKDSLNNERLLPDQGLQEDKKRESVAAAAKSSHGIVEATIVDLGREPSSLDHVQGTTVIKIVKEGENLSQLTQNVYGFVSPQLVEWVKHHNPHIPNADNILPGDRIVFPPHTVPFKES